MGASGIKQGMNTLNAAPPQDVIEGGCSHLPMERSNGIHQDGPATSLADKIEENNVMMCVDGFSDSERTPKLHAMS